jgi:hypothetical protein
MNTPITIDCDVHFERRGHGARKELAAGPAPAPPPPRIPRLARLMALALRYEAMVRTGQAQDFAELARLGHVTRARMSQLVSLVNLAPDIVEDLLFQPAVTSGRDPLILRDVLPIAAVTDWAKQRRMWRALSVRAESRTTSTGN